MTEKVRPNIVPFIALTTIALPLLVAGIISFTNPELLPWPPNPQITWSLIGVGALMDLIAVIMLVSELQKVGRINANTT